MAHQARLFKLYLQLLLVLALFGPLTQLVAGSSATQAPAGLHKTIDQDAALDTSADKSAEMAQQMPLYTPLQQLPAIITPGNALDPRRGRSKPAGQQPSNGQWAVTATPSTTSQQGSTAAAPTDAMAAAGNTSNQSALAGSAARSAATPGAQARAAMRQQHRIARSVVSTTATSQTPAEVPVSATKPAAAKRTAATAAVAGTANIAPFDGSMSPTASQLSPSILLMGYCDWGLSAGADGKPWSRCLDMVWRARRLSGGNKLNFVPTHHWLPRDDGFGVSSFCFLQYNEAGVSTCIPWTAQKVQEFQQSMTLCVAEAIRQGFTPYLRPHLDDGLNRGVWRNGLQFGPAYKYSDFSYKDIMLDPLAAAVADALKTTEQEGMLLPQADKDQPEIYFGLQGEMSATIMRYTTEWAALIPGIRATLGNLASVKIGIGLNFNALDAVEGSKPSGGLLGLLTGSRSRASRYPAPPIDGAAVSELVTQLIDFIGISAYAPYTGPGMQLNEFENSAFNVADSLKSLANGVDLAALVNSGKLELHYSEFGIGGGQSGNAAPAIDAHRVGKQPWAGVAGPYHPATDPWQRPDLQAFRAEFYTKALQWLANPTIKTYQVNEVFVWGMASWDLFGTYPDSSTPQGTYRDANLVQLTSRHNMRVVTAQVMAAKGVEAAQQTWVQLQTAEAEYAQFYEQTTAMPDADRMRAARLAGDDQLRANAGYSGSADSSGTVVTESAPLVLFG